MGLHIGQRRLLLLWRGGADLHPHQLCGHGLAQMLTHGLKQIEALRFIFIERIALAVSAQSDHLTQMVEHDQMLAPEMVERLQQNRFLDIADHVDAPLGNLGGHEFVSAPLDSRQQFFVGNAFFLSPFIDRQIEIEYAQQFLFQAGRIPLFRIGVLRHEF